MTDPAPDGRRTGLEQSVIECAPGSSVSRAAGQCEEVLFVLTGEGDVAIHGERHPVEPETGAYFAPGEEYELSNRSSQPMRVVSVRISDPVPPDRDPPDPPDPDGGSEDRTVVRRLADQEAHDATTARWFRIVADPTTGLRSATQFVGYIPTERAPEHFHMYDEVIYVIEGEGTLHTGGDRTPVAAGSCLELPARTVHCLENTGESVMRLVAVFRPAGSPAAAYYPDGTPAYPGTPPVMTG